jgi:AraC family transcriptional regulator of adaptative response/methylated-DNA-[protein]-cysteine methyltransferase
MSRIDNDGDEPMERIDQALRRAAESNFELGVEDLVAASGYSRGHFQRLFRRRVGLSPGRFLRHGRIERFARLLREGQSVTEAALAAGFGSSSRAHQAARDGFGMAPSTLAAGGAGETLRYGIAACTFGRVLAAATGRGLCAVLLGDRDRELLDELEQRFRSADRHPGGPEFERIMGSVVALVDRAETADPAFPLDLRGTVFQKRVWSALQDIPPGRTITYGELARRLGVPGGARAVAQACGANPAAVIVPCHRVVAADGSLGGYRWGIERKRALLARERE